MRIIETRPREISFVLGGHCQNLLDDPRKMVKGRPTFKTPEIRNYSNVFKTMNWN